MGVFNIRKSKKREEYKPEECCMHCGLYEVDLQTRKCGNCGDVTLIREPDPRNLVTKIIDKEWTDPAEDRGVRYCSMCNIAFSSISEYRQHHYAAHGCSDL